jgi:hypothetical protein
MSMNILQPARINNPILFRAQPRRQDGGGPSRGRDDAQRPQRRGQRRQRQGVHSA